MAVSSMKAAVERDPTGAGAFVTNCRLIAFAHRAGGLVTRIAGVTCIHAGDIPQNEKTQREASEGAIRDPGATGRWPGPGYCAEHWALDEKLTEIPIFRGFRAP